MERRKFCVIGYPIMHSKSPELFEEIFKEQGIEGCSYEKIEVRSRNELAAFFERMRAGAYDACNVTMPLKTDAAEMLDGLTEEAAALHAVNSVVCRAGKLYGHSTDGDGMCSAVESHGGTITGSRIVLLGSGGAARSIAAAVSGRDCGALTVICRTGKNRELMREMLQNSYPEKAVCEYIDYADSRAAGAAINAADILINATSIGMAPQEEECALPAGTAFHAGMTVADAVYNPEETIFLKKAAESGCITVTGFEMLKGQAQKAAEFFLEAQQSGIKL